MGSLFTSVIPNLISKQIIDAIDKSKCKIIYVCNLMTQPGETDNYSVSKHISVLNAYLGRKKIDTVIVNSEKIKSKIIKKYRNLEQKDLVKFEKNDINIDIIYEPLLFIDDDNTLKHDSMKLGLEILKCLLK